MGTVHLEKKDYTLRYEYQKSSLLDSLYLQKIETEVPYNQKLWKRR